MGESTPASNHSVSNIHDGLDLPERSEQGSGSGSADRSQRKAATVLALERLLIGEATEQGVTGEGTAEARRDARTVVVTELFEDVRALLQGLPGRVVVVQPL